MAAWAAILAAFGTVITLVLAMMTLRVQVRADVTRQASRIIVDMDADGDEDYVVVRNLSDLPINDLRGRVIIHRGKSLLFTRRKAIDLQPDRNRLAPGAEARALLPSYGDLHLISTVVFFRDSSGFAWSRQLPSQELFLIDRGPLRGIAAATIVSIGFFGLAAMIMTNKPHASDFALAFIVLILAAYGIRQAYNKARAGYWKRVGMPTSRPSSSAESNTQHHAKRHRGAGTRLTTDRPMRATNGLHDKDSHG